jgi:hypothetical protein
MPSLISLRRSIQRLGPYASLALVALPLAIVEPMKLAAVVVFGAGHWMTGSFVMICAYALSVFFIEQLFKLVKPQLLKLPWFARVWTWFVGARRQSWLWLLAKWTRGRKTAYGRRTLKRCRGRSSAPAVARKR